MADQTDATHGRALLPVGTKVEVQTGFDGSWTTGFEIHEHTTAGYRLRRRSDAEVLPASVSPDAVRKERKNAMWWY